MLSIGFKGALDHAVNSPVRYCTWMQWLFIELMMDKMFTHHLNLVTVSSGERPNQNWCLVEWEIAVTMRDHWLTCHLLSSPEAEVPEILHHLLQVPFVTDSFVLKERCKKVSNIAKWQLQIYEALLQKVPQDPTMVIPDLSGPLQSFPVPGSLKLQPINPESSKSTAWFSPCKLIRWPWYPGLHV